MSDAATVAKELREITQRGHRNLPVFDDWVAATLAALCRDEEAYRDRIQSYPNDADRGDREADHFAHATGKLFKAMAQHERDILGEVYEELGLHNEDNGQFFTPHDVTRLMVQMTVSGDEESISDPACGSGRMLLEASRIVPEALFIGRDLDPICVRMAAINLCVFNVNSVIVLGDSMKLTREKAWRTFHTSEGGAVTEIDPDDIAWIDEDEDEPSVRQTTLLEAGLDG